MLVCAFSWEQRKLGERMYIKSRVGWQALTKNEYMSTGDYYLITGTDIDPNHTVDLSRSYYVSKERYEMDTNIQVKNGDIIITKDGTIGKVAMISGLDKPATLNSHLFVLRDESGELDNNFFLQLLCSHIFEQFVESVKTGSTLTGLPQKTIVEFKFLYPSLEEQEKIGTYFRNLDHLITLHQRECFSFDFGSRSAKVAQKTISWEQRELGEMGSTYTGLSGKTKEDFGHGEAKFITYMNVFSNPVADLQMTESVEIDSKQNCVKAGDVFFTTSSETPEEVGMSCVMPESADNIYLNSFCFGYRPTEKFDLNYLAYVLRAESFRKEMTFLAQGISRYNISKNKVMEVEIPVPSLDEQSKVGQYFTNLDNLITLHQREPPKEDKILNDIKTDTLFHEYYCQWLVIYKEGSVRGVTMQKYHLTAEWVKKLIPDVKLCDFDRITYQQLINDYAETHERQTTMDFHHQLKGAILDAVDDGLIARDPTRKVIIKGKSPNDKKKKYLSRYELQKLLTSLDLNSGLNMDWLILLIAKTGMRFSEAIAVTPMDFDFTHQTLSVNKTWDYKGEGGFQPTKNKSSVRKIRLDWQTVGQFYAIVRELNDTAPIFVSKEKKIYNSTLNDVLERHCKAVGIPTISVHGLRHTHASLLLFDGVSIASVAQRLGHSSINTTQKTYLHIIRELENKDIDLIMKSISSLLD